MSDLMSVREAEREAGVTKQHIISLIREGIIKGQKVGNAFVIDRASFEQWLTRRRARQAQEGKAEQGEAEQSDQGEPERAEAGAHA